MKKRGKTASKVSAPKKGGKGVYFVLGLILLAALFLRLYQPDWYNERQFHPDERWIVGSAVPAIKHWGDKPIGLQYGSLPLYILHTYRSAVETLRKTVMPRMNMNTAYIGGARVISALFDTGTIVFIFLAASLLFGNAVALFASALLAFTALHIHASHFFTVDTFVTFFIAGGFYFASRIYRYGKLQDYILSGAFYGMALASKTAALPFVLVILSAHIFNWLKIKGITRAAKKERTEAWVRLGWAAAISFAAFFISMPHAILSFEQFSRDQQYQSHILVTGKGDVPYNRQYLNTAPYLYYIKNLVVYTMGIPYGAAAFLAFGFYLFLIARRLKEGKGMQAELLLLFAWMLPYFIVVGSSFAKFNRYMLPLTPFLAVLAAKLLIDFGAWVKEKKFSAVVNVIVIGGAAFYGLAFMNIYKNPHTWIEASRWIYKNAPTHVQDESGITRQTAVLNEMWGDDLPTHTDGGHPGMYRNLKWNVQEPDSPRKLDELSMMLEQADYVMMADKRAYGTYLRIPHRYPLNYFYYSTMLSNPEKLGFKMALDLAVYPKLFGIKIKDDKADESYQLYDHPHVYIFKKETQIPRAELRAIIAEGQAQIAAKYRPGAAVAGHGVKEKAAYPNPNIGEMRDRTKAFLPQFSVFIWYLLVQALAVIVMPLFFIIFRNLDDKGWALAKIGGIFFFAWINWIIVSTGAWKFYQMNLLILFAGLAAAAFVWYRANFEKVKKIVKEKFRHILVTETVFLGAYMLFILIKLWFPNIHDVAGHGYNGGGEPMGMAYLSAIYNDVKFPPHDPWLAGFTLNYYYWGQLMIASIAKLLGYLPRLSYNLSLALLFAVSFTAAFGLVRAMTGKYRYGLLAGFLLALAGNFHTLMFIMDKFVNSHSIQAAANSIMSFQFIWDPTRIYPSPVITEMPFFSWLYGDLHAHNIVIPVAVLGIALLYSVFSSANKTTNAFYSFGDKPFDMGVTAAALAVITGSMLAINTWNFPPQIMLALGVLVFLGWRLYADNMKFKKKEGVEARLKAGALPLATSLAAAAAVGVAAYLAFLPFHANFISPYETKVQQISQAERAPLFVMLKYFGVFFFMILAYLYTAVFSAAGSAASDAGFKKIKRFDFNKIMKTVSKALDKIMDAPATAVKFIAAAAAVILIIFLAFYQPTFALLAAMMAAVLYAGFKAHDRKEIFSLVLIFMSLGITLGTELFYIADGRMNTVFKFYMVAWVLLALGVPYILKLFYDKFAKALREEKRDWLILTAGVLGLIALIFGLHYIDARQGGRFVEALFIALVILAPAAVFFLRNKTGKYIFSAALLFVLVPAVLYPVLGSAAKMSICSMGFKEKPRIDGMEYMKNLRQRPGAVRDFDRHDYQAMEWMEKNYLKIEPFLETPGENMYSGVSRISIFTGMPTLVGWGYQVGQQSGRGSEVAQRNQAANNAYRTPSGETAKQILGSFGVKYVYSGAIEKNTYGSGTAKFDDFADKVYSNEGAELYKIRQ